jgi:hypothetical protein
MARKILFYSLIFASVFFLSSCAIGEKPEVKKPDTLEEALETEVNNPIDNAVKLHQVKDKLEDRLNEYQDNYNQQAEQVLD